MSVNADEVTVTPEAASCLCTTQGGIQAILRPGLWIPGIRSLHVYEEYWKVSANPIVCVDDVLTAVHLLKHSSLKGNVFTIKYVEKDPTESRVEIIVYSRMRYVFVIELNFNANESEGGSLGSVKAFVSGIMPAWFPLGFVFSCLLFFFPFYDFGYNEIWVKLLRSRVKIPLEIIKHGRTC